MVLGIVLCVATAVATPDRVISSVREIREAPDIVYDCETPFAFDGVISVIDKSSHWALVTDASGSVRVFFDAPGLVRPPVGTAVKLTGILKLSSERERLVMASACEIVGRRTPPPPIDLSVHQILGGADNQTHVRTGGTVVEVFPDEVDANYTRVVLYDKGMSIDVAVSHAEYAFAFLKSLVNAEIRLTGVCAHKSGWQRFSSPSLSVISDIEIVRPAPEDPFDIEPLRNPGRSTQAPDPCGARRRAEGLVVAAWHGDRLLIKTADGLVVRVRLAEGIASPPQGSFATVAGLIDTDSANLLMRDAIWKPALDNGLKPVEPTAVKARELFLDASGRPAIQYGYDGAPIRITGTVLSLHADQPTSSRLLIDSDGFTLTVNASNCPQSLSTLEPGCRIEVTGTCLIDFASWRRNAPFPHVRGLSIIVNGPGDILLLDPAPFWTPKRLLSVIGILFALIVGIAIWNRILQTLVTRKGRELFRMQIAKAESELRISERTRLAAELHDYTAQNLAAVSYQVAAAKNACAAGPTAERLSTAERMISSCVVELRRCLWDLRNDALDEPDLAKAVRKTVAPVACGAALSVRFDVRRVRINDSVAHAVLSIARELVSNAVRHGHARHIRIAGAREGGTLMFSVRDDGIGFDAASRPGPDRGHFGLSGVSERTKRFRGALNVVSAPQQGTRVTVTLHLATDETES